jgi:hypothetical protein
MLSWWYLFVLIVWPSLDHIQLRLEYLQLAWKILLVTAHILQYLANLAIIVVLLLQLLSIRIVIWRHQRCLSLVMRGFCCHIAYWECILQLISSECWVQRGVLIHTHRSLLYLILLQMLTCWGDHHLIAKLASSTATAVCCLQVTIRVLTFGGVIIMQKVYIWNVRLLFVYGLLLRLIVDRILVFYLSKLLLLIRA